MSKQSIFTQNLKQSFKQKRINDLPIEEKNKFRLKTIEQFFLELSNRENRFIFYCWLRYNNADRHHSIWGDA